MNLKTSKFHFILAVLFCLSVVRPPCVPSSPVAEIMFAENRAKMSEALEKIARVGKSINKLKNDISKLESARPGKENMFERLVRRLENLEKLENELDLIAIDESKLEKLDIFNDPNKLKALRAELKESGLKDNEMEIVINYFYERRDFIKKKKTLAKIISSINALKADINNEEKLRGKLNFSAAFKRMSAPRES